MSREVRTGATIKTFTVQLPRTFARPRTDAEWLIKDLEALRQHHEFTRDRVGAPGCIVRQKAAEYVETINRAITTIEGTMP